MAQLMLQDASSWLLTGLLLLPTAQRGRTLLHLAATSGPLFERAWQLYSSAGCASIKVAASWKVEDKVRAGQLPAVLGITGQQSAPSLIRGPWRGARALAAATTAHYQPALPGCCPVPRAAGWLPACAHGAGVQAAGSCPAAARAAGVRWGAGCGTAGQAQGHGERLPRASCRRAAALAPLLAVARRCQHAPAAASSSLPALTWFAAVVCRAARASTHRCCCWLSTTASRWRWRRQRAPRCKMPAWLWLSCCCASVQLQTKTRT